MYKYIYVITIEDIIAVFPIFVSSIEIKKQWKYVFYPSSKSWQWMVFKDNIIVKGTSPLKKKGFI